MCFVVVADTEKEGNLSDDNTIKKEIDEGL